MFMASGQNAQVVHIDVRTETVDGIAEHVLGTRGREGLLALGGLGPQVIWAAGDVVVDVGGMLFWAAHSSHRRGLAASSTWNILLTRPTLRGISSSCLYSKSRLL